MQNCEMNLHSISIRTSSGKIKKRQVFSNDYSQDRKMALKFPESIANKLENKKMANYRLGAFG